MNKFLIIISILSAITALPCNAQNESNQEKTKTTKITRAQKRAEKAAKIANEIKESLINKKIIIGITKIYPIGEQARTTTSQYTVKIINDTLTCYLPYFGSSKTPVYGGQSLAIEANNQKIKMEGGFDAKSESYIFKFNFINENTKNECVCTMQIYDNQVSHLMVGDVSKDIMQYDGEFLLSDLK